MVAKILFAIGNVATLMVQRCGKKIAADSRARAQRLAQQTAPKKIKFIALFCLNLHTFKRKLQQC